MPDRDDADYIRTRPRRKRVRMADVVGCGLLGVAALIAGLAVLAAVFWFRPAGQGGGGLTAVVSTVAGLSAEREGVDWSHKELLAYMNARGGRVGDGTDHCRWSAWPGGGICPCRNRIR